ncbi:hypothetical protein EV702DRAFT_424891 [Suillus placidus]|uniref:Uncharacterized protein n=1 Tax=Suillus placidus TaxID=48579 RepID=A0A9P6ZRV8_9AGAM|nr:hypothetical protein EV702DRAFT_424891 [Suillus placidus]
MSPHPQQKEHNARRSNYRINLRAKLRQFLCTQISASAEKQHSCSTHSSPSQVTLQTCPTSETAPPTIHANSHASMLSDPSSVSTSVLTLAAIQEGEEGGSLLDALISALIEPVPFGVDGEIEKDDEFQENVVKILYTFATSCSGAFSAVQKRSLWGFLGGIATTQGEENLNFGLTSGEWGVGSGEWGVGSGEWGVGSGEWGVGSGEWGVGSGEWGVGSGRS